MDKSIVNEVVSALEAVKSYGQPGFWILLSILIVLVLVIAAVMYQRIVIKRFQTASKATQENFETIAADLRKRALEVKKQDEGLRRIYINRQGGLILLNRTRQSAMAERTADVQAHWTRPVGERLRRKLREQ